MQGVMLVVAVMVLAVGGGQVMAVDIAAGEMAPTYLEQSVRMQWRKRPLNHILADIEAWIERPLVRSKALPKPADLRKDTGRPVYLMAPAKVSLRTALDHLESAMGLCFTAEALRLRVETLAEYQARHRRPVRLGLRDYGAYVAPYDHSFFPVITGKPSGVGGFDYFGGGFGGSDRDYVDMEHVMLRFGESVDGEAMDLAATGQVHTLVTEAEEAVLRQLFEDEYQHRMRRRGWRVVTGLLPEGTKLPTTAWLQPAKARQFAAELRQSVVLELVGFSSQRVSATNRTEHGRVADLDVGGEGAWDQVVETGRDGVAAAIRTIVGRSFDRVSFELHWADAAKIQEQVVRSVDLDGATTAIDLDIDGSTTPEDEDDEENADRTLNGSASGTVSSDPRAPQQQMTLQLEQQWRWRPRIEALVPQQRGLVLHTIHPKGTAVVVLEPLVEGK